MSRIKIIILKLTILIVISSFFFYIGNLLTVRPTDISGNGNLSLLAIPAVLLCLIFLVVEWTKLIRFFNINIPALIAMFIGLSLVLFWRISYQVDAFRQKQSFVRDVALQREIEGGASLEASLEYVNQIAGWSSPYMSNQLFNLNTFLIFVCIPLLLGTVVTIINKLKKQT
ncbi:hypothetical protein I3U53_24630 [Mycobacteroides abscessus subsp. abscessus]|nr:hypothetical protein [Mycobacteroides abscessus subsp. abscessus]